MYNFIVGYAKGIIDLTLEAAIGTQWEDYRDNLHRDNPVPATLTASLRENTKEEAVSHYEERMLK